MCCSNMKYNKNNEFKNTVNKIRIKKNPQLPTFSNFSQVHLKKKKKVDPKETKSWNRLKNHPAQ